MSLSCYIRYNRIPYYYFCRSNFLQVDLYYEQLQYEEVEQQKAFVLASLFGEVGGYMGLLLGASCMTLVELVDYLLIVCKARLRKRKVDI